MCLLTLPANWIFGTLRGSSPTERDCGIHFFVAIAMNLAWRAFKALQSGAPVCSLGTTDRLPKPCGVRQLTPGARPLAGTKSDTIYALESQSMMPPVFEENEAPVRSALELTSTRMAGPKFCVTVPPRGNSSAFPSKRIAADRGSPEI